jgi:hypothetical protein
MSALPQSIQRGWIVAGAALLLLLLLLSVSVVRVPEDKQAIILQLGKPVATVNTYQPNQAFGETGAGLVLKTPFVQNVVFIDKRILPLDIAPQTVLSTDQLRLVVDAFARFRIVDPLRMYQTVRTEERVAEELGEKMGKVAQPLRLAIVGRAASPGIDVTLQLVGKEATPAVLVILTVVALVVVVIGGGAGCDGVDCDCTRLKRPRSWEPEMCIGETVPGDEEDQTADVAAFEGDGCNVSLSGRGGVSVVV